MSNNSDKMKEINLKLTLDEVNLVLAALGRMPFQEVYGLVHKIHAQSSEQWEEQPGELPEEPEQTIEEEK